MILYRHAKAERMDDGRRLLVGYANLLVGHRHFTPERIRRFVRSSLPLLIADIEAGKITVESLNDVISSEIREPTASLKQAFACLTQDHKRLLVSRLDVEPFFWKTDDRDCVESFERHRPSGSTSLYAALEKDLSLSFLSKTDWYFDWVHPSMRDLVIDYLAETASEREHFLSVCSATGLKLALSAAGGAEGTRQCPLIVDIKDKTIVGLRVQELFKTQPSDKIVELLSVIYDCSVDLEQSIRTAMRNFRVSSLPNGNGP